MVTSKCIIACCPSATFFTFFHLASAGDQQPIHTVGGNILSQVLPRNKKTISVPVLNNKSRRREDGEKKFFKMKDQR